MKCLFFLGHPAHFHLFKNIIKKLEEHGDETLVLIKSKDILEELCLNEGINFRNIYRKERRKSTLGILISFLFKYIGISKNIRKFRPEILIGSEPTLPHLGKLFGIPSFVFSEDDTHIIPQFAKIAYPFVTEIISPISCDAGKWSHKKTAYDGFHKLTYLHPSQFQPNEKVKESLPEDYFIIRTTNLSAYHDTNKKGISEDILGRLIEILEPHGKVFITSEKPISDKFLKYVLKINPNYIHTVLSGAKIYIGDSQSMAVESALLGTPGIRFNDFANQIGVLNELETKYGLTRGIAANDREKLYQIVREMLQVKDLKMRHRKKLNKLLQDKINTCDFFVWYIKNYPQSKTIHSEQSEFQYTFQ